ncbi:MAG: hypothetical protein KU37_03425 [Sulfuricurvum sp. PC08-66]|nr:MAG: hypothetical protein KU37_03425 [Sulfuricurvum sp. PC08-66]
MLRILTFATAGAISAIVLFWLLSLLVAQGDGYKKESSTPKNIDFIRHQKSSDLEAKSRVRPPKPQTPPPPPTPQMALNEKPPKPQITPMKLNAPRITLPTNIKGDLAINANVGSGNMEVIPLVRIAPMYPKAALRMKKEGYVTLRFFIDPKGSVTSASVVASQPEGLFDDAALRAIKRWKFKPKLVNGEAVEQEGEQTINFSLEQAQ